MKTLDPNGSDSNFHVYNPGSTGFPQFPGEIRLRETGSGIEYPRYAGKAGRERGQQCEFRRGGNEKSTRKKE